MASPDGFTFLGSCDFEAYGVLGLNRYTSTIGVGDINFSQYTAGSTDNARFINLWNAGGFGVTISGTVDPFDYIDRLGNYNLRASAELFVRYTTPATQPAPLPSNPPLELSAVESKWNATSLDDARVKAGFSSPVSILDFLGTAPTIPDPEDSEDASIDNKFGLGWSEFTSDVAETGFGTSSVGPVGFYFSTETVPIPSNATITEVRIRALNGVFAGPSGTLAAAEYWLEDVNWLSGS